MNTRVHVMTLSQAELFYHLCGVHKADTAEQRTILLEEMRKCGLLTRVYDTNRSRDEVIQDFSKHYTMLLVKDKSNAQ